MLKEQERVGREVQEEVQQKLREAENVERSYRDQLQGAESDMQVSDGLHDNFTSEEHLKQQSHHNSDIGTNACYF